jgi:uncharacterized protein (DUF362 family)
VLPAAAGLVAHVTQADHGAGLAAAIERAVAPFGGWGALVQPGERIAVKINLLRAAAPERAITTHPETVRCVIRGLKAAGADPFVADSPGGPGARTFAMRAYQTTGILDVCKEEAVEAVWVDESIAKLAAPQGKLFREFPVGQPWVDAAGIVQVGIVKTHGLMRLTGGVKLAFGCVAGLSKAQLHLRAQRRSDFADMLLDLYLALRPRFTVMDGIVAMEGKGPGSGTPHELGSLFAARDAIALDAAIADRTAHQRQEVYTLAAAARRGLIDLAHAYELVGDAVEPDHTFVPAKWDADTGGTSRGRRLGRRLLTARPRLVDAAACNACGDCAAMCGVGAITMDGEPLFDDATCVRCFCCTEICPTAAIAEVSPALARAAGALRRRRR